MSFSTLRRRNRGAYGCPFSGVGLEFYPLGIAPDQSGIVLHEAGFLPRNDWWVFPNVFSPFWRLYYNFRKGHKVIFPDREVALTPSRIMLIPDRCLFHCEGRVPVPNLWLAFSVGKRLASGTAVPLMLAPTRAEMSLLCAIAGIIGSGDSRRESAYFSGLGLLHLVLGRREIRWSGGVVPEGVRRALRRIDAGYAGDLPIPLLAREAGVSVRGFGSAFRRATGRAPGRYIVEIRVREAARQLVEGGASIDQIAEATGFPNRNYFSRVFKAVAGESPALFRERHGEGALGGRGPRRAV